MASSDTLRYFWTSKVLVEGNNYDFSQGDSCLRTHLSFQIGLREHSAQLASILDELVASIDDEPLFRSTIDRLQLLRTVAQLDNGAFIVRSSFVDGLVSPNSCFVSRLVAQTVDHRRTARTTSSITFGIPS
jgi:hypothetical protein